MKILPMSISNLLLAGVAMAIAPSAKANTIVYDNLGAASSGADQVLYVGPLHDSFTSSTTETLTGLQLALLSYGGPGTLTIGLYSSALRDSLITTLGIVDVLTLTTGVIKDYTIPLLTHPTLAAGSRYWIGLVADTGSIAWSWSSDTSGAGVSGEYWARDGIAYPNSVGGPYQMRLEACPVVPDSANTACILALSISGLILICKSSAKRGWRSASLV